jgi:hypothetical protein
MGLSCQVSRKGRLASVESTYRALTRGNLRHRAGFPRVGVLSGGLIRVRASAARAFHASAASICWRSQQSPSDRGEPKGVDGPHRPRR